MDYNKVFLAGRLTHNVELKQTQSGISVVSFSLAVNRYAKKGEERQADFLNCVAYRQTAEIIAQHCGKGDNIFVEAQVQNRSYEDKQGNKRTITEFIVNNVQFLSKKGENTSNAYVPPAYTEPAIPKYENIAPDEDLPF